MQSSSPAPLRPTPYGFHYPSPHSPTGISSSSGGGPPRRPGARRAHSFCGDPSAFTFALASVNACAHLSANKRDLVAPPLERTLSSIGSRGNQSPTGQQMLRPEIRDESRARAFPTPPASPPSPTVPLIFVQTSSPTRPNLTTNQSPPQPALAPLSRVSGASVTSSRSSSCTIVTPGTPLVEPTFSTIGEEDVGDEENHNDLTRRWVKARLPKELVDEIEEDDMMEVDGMVERVEELML